MKLGANSVLFGGYDMETAFKYLAMAGYDGIEISAIPRMSEHLVLERWQEITPEIKRLSQVYGLELLAMEQPSQDPATMEMAMQAAVAAGIPIINCGPGGKTDDATSLQQSIDSLGNLAQMAEKYGVTIIGVFGSYVRNEQRADSDIDVLIELERPTRISLLGLVELEHYLSDVLGTKVDVAIKQNLKKRIGKRILSEVVPV